MINVFTIGVYNSTEDVFFDKLTHNNIDLFCDIRQRRGMRGAQYKYVNSTYLQAKLAKLEIPYIHIKSLAPTNQIRQKQKDIDKQNNETKKLRDALGDVFISEYRKQILDIYDIESFIEELQVLGVKNIVFFCVEEHAKACHRSLVAQRFSEKLKTNFLNL